LVGLACRRRLNYLARKTLFRHPLFRHLIHFFDAIPIDRDGMGVEGIKETIRRLRRDEMVLIFPEGTRTSDGDLRRLKPGFCSLARRGATTLQPVAIDGAYQCWPRQAKAPRLDRIAIVFGPPMTPDDIASMENKELIAELAARIEICHRRARQLRQPPDQL
jgi:1-acyl-sn-glycerol-3-phosphate acyltransferase